MTKIGVIVVLATTMVMFLSFCVRLNGPVGTQEIKHREVIYQAPRTSDGVSCPTPEKILPRIRPDPDSTEGSVRLDGHNRDRMCGFSKGNRGRMTPERRDEVLIRYGLPPGPHPDYEIDHLIPLCLGGSDDFTNLWPQPRRSIEAEWNAEAKDRLESKICYLVCSGEADLATAQEDIARDWIAAYHKYVKPYSKRQSTFVPPEGFGSKPRLPVEPQKRSTNPVFVPPATFAMPGPHIPTAPSAETRVSFTTDDYSIHVPGRINNAITVDFTLDSGAALVSIPPDVFQALRQSHYIADSDMRSEETFMMADGRLRREQTFIIRSLKVGDATAQKVEASTGGPTALLGQSFLTRFKSWQIDNSQRVIILGRQ
jgi:hypothetical protein